MTQMLVPRRPRLARKRGVASTISSRWSNCGPPSLCASAKRSGVTAVAYLHDARPVGFSDEEIVLEFNKEFHFAKATEASKRLPFEDKINETLDKPRRLRLQMAPAAAQSRGRRPKSKKTTMTTT